MAQTILWAVAAGMLYAFLLVGTEVKFSQYSPQILQVCFYPVMLLITVMWLASRRGMGLDNTLPTAALLVFAIVLGVVYYFADVALLKALTTGGTATAVAVVLAMSPVFTALVRFLWVGGLPNRYHVIAFLLAVATVVVATKGEIVANTE